MKPKYRRESYFIKHSLLLLLTLALSPLGCTLPLNEAACPCAEGWTCCTDQNLCVPEGATCPTVVTDSQGVAKNADAAILDGTSEYADGYTPVDGSGWMGDGGFQTFDGSLVADMGYVKNDASQWGGGDTGYLTADAGGWFGDTGYLTADAGGWFGDTGYLTADAGGWFGDAGYLTADAGGNYDAGYLTADAGQWAFDAGYLTADAGQVAFDAGYLTADAECCYADGLLATQDSGATVKKDAGTGR